MKTISFQCNNCGSKLEVNASTNFCICASCKSSLQVKYSGSAYFSKVLDRKTEQAEEASTNSEQLLLKQELRILEEEWESIRKTFEMRSRNGSVSMPSRGFAMLGGVLAVVLVLAALIVTSISSGGGSFILIIVIPIAGLAIWSVFSVLNKAAEYESAKEKYDTKRESLLKELSKYD